MDRLTEIYFDEFGIKHAKLKDNIAKKTYRSYTFTPQEIANEKLSELEDFMEKHKCHSVGDLMLEFTISAVEKLNLKLTEEKLAEMKTKLAEKDIEIERLELSLKRACEAVFDEEIPYDEIQEMKRKHNRYTVGIVLEDVLFYYKKLAEEELRDVKD